MRKVNKTSQSGCYILWLLLRHVLVARLVLVTILSFRHINRVQVDIVVSAHVRNADDIELEIVTALRQSELKLDAKVLLDRNLLDRQQLPRTRLTNHEPPVCHLTPRKEGSDHALVILVVLVCVS